ncbi:YidH family protein [Photobacterium sp. DNB22_13_2]
MKRIKQRLPRHTWRNEGEAPDYRFSLANERTYLAWIRTALALLAGAIGIDQLTPDLADPLVRVLISSFLCLCSGLLAVFAYRRWSQNEKAMRTNAQLKYTGFLKIISFVMLFFTFVVILVILL